MTKFENKQFKAGDPFVPQAHEFQRQREMANKRDRPNPARANFEQPCKWAYIKNVLSYDLDFGHPVILGNFEYNEGTGWKGDGFFNAVEPSDDDKRLGICLGTIPQGQWGRVAISGIVYALTKGGAGDRITLLPTSDVDYKSKVTRSTNGAARWLANVDDGALIELGAGGNQTRWIQFTLTAALTSPGTATATVDYDNEDEGNVGETVTVTGILSYAGAIGDKGVALKRDDAWLVIELKQGGSSTPKPVFLVQGVLTVRPTGSAPLVSYGAHADEATAYVDSASLIPLSLEPFTEFTPFSSCANPHGLNGLSGDPCIIAWDSVNERYYLMAVLQQKAMVFFELAADRGNGLAPTTNVSITADVRAWRGHGTGPTTVYDRFNVAINAKVGHEGIAEWNADVGQWVIVACQHCATDIKGKTGSPGTGGEGTYLTPEIGFDGPLDGDPPDDIETEPFEWDHPGSDKDVWVKLDPVTGLWHVYQIACPDQGEPA